MWCLPSLDKINAAAVANKKNYDRQIKLKKSVKHSCECCGQPSTVHEKWYDIFSDDAKGVRHLCQSCAEDGRGDEGYFTCDCCGRLMVENYTWERYEKDGICLACAAVEYFNNDENLIDPKQVEKVVLEPGKGRLFESGVLNIAHAPHVLGVKQAVPKGIKFVDNAEFDSMDGHQISGGNMLFDIQQMTQPFYCVCDSGWQFAFSIGLYIREHSTPSLAVRVNHANSNHHLWNNHGTWWCHFTVHKPDFTKARIRRSLGTTELTLARARRDALLNGGIATACCARSTQ
jgi:hypothetical protein